MSFCEDVTFKNGPSCAFDAERDECAVIDECRGIVYRRTECGRDGEKEQEELEGVEMHDFLSDSGV